jgi:hypothetical protein
VWEPEDDAEEPPMDVLDQDENFWAAEEYWDEEWFPEEAAELRAEAEAEEMEAEPADE